VPRLSEAGSGHGRCAHHTEEDGKKAFHGGRS
jgi:hypothetical protein